MRDCGIGRAAQVLRSFCVRRKIKAKLGSRWLELREKKESWPDRVLLRTFASHSKAIAFLCLVAIRTRSR